MQIEITKHTLVIMNPLLRYKMHQPNIYMYIDYTKYNNQN